MTIELLCDVGRDPLAFGMRARTRHEVYEGFGSECGTTTPTGEPTGAVWVRCPKVPIVRNRSGDIVSWKSAYVIVEPNDFAVAAEENEALPTTPRPTTGALETR